MNFVDASNKAIYYRDFKVTISYEPYLSCPRFARSLIARLRCSSHDLLVETGRWSRPVLPYINRICTRCNLNLIEDEFHFVLICPAYVELRTRFIEDRFRENPTRNKFII